MNILRKLALTATAIAAMASFNTAFAADEVKLGFASLERDASPGAGRCPSCFNVFGEIEVKNIARNKEVWVWYNTGIGGWKTQKATYDTQIGNGKETWDFKVVLNNIFPATVQIAIQYKVNGQTYWDNNSTKNYNLGGTNAFNKLNTVNLFPSDTPVKAVFDQFQGSVILKNIARDKKVKIVYSLDNWLTTKEVFAKFGAIDTTAAESWGFITSIPVFDCNNLPNIQYYITYSVAGTTYTDNNHGRNYKVNHFETSCPTL